MDQETIKLLTGFIRNFTVRSAEESRAVYTVKSSSVLFNFAASETGTRQLLS